MAQMSNGAMARVESILVPMEFTTASHAHECGYDDRHSLETGMARLTILDEHGEEHHYCLNCARAFLREGLEQVQVLLEAAKRLADI